MVRFTKDSYQENMQVRLESLSITLEINKRR